MFSPNFFRKANTNVYKSFLATRLLGQIREDKSVAFFVIGQDVGSTMWIFALPFLGTLQIVCRSQKDSMFQEYDFYRNCLPCDSCQDMVLGYNIIWWKWQSWFSSCSVAFESYKPFHQRFWKYKDVDRVWTQFQCGLDDPALVVSGKWWYHNPSLKKGSWKPLKSFCKFIFVSCLACFDSIACSFDSILFACMFDLCYMFFLSQIKIGS